MSEVESQPLHIDPDNLRRITPDRIMISLNLPVNAPDGEYDFAITGARLTLAAGSQLLVLVGTGTHADVPGAAAKRHAMAKAAARGAVPGSAVAPINATVYGAPPAATAPAPAPVPFGLPPAAAPTPAPVVAVAPAFSAPGTTPAVAAVADEAPATPAGPTRTVYNIKLHPQEGSTKDKAVLVPGPDNVEEIMVVASSPREARQIAVEHIASLPGGSVATCDRWASNETDLFPLGPASPGDARKVIRVAFCDG